MKTNYKLRKVEGTFRKVEDDEYDEYVNYSKIPDEMDIVAMNLGYGNYDNMEPYMKADWC